MPSAHFRAGRTGFVVALPRGHQVGPPLPVLFALHGRGDRALDMVRGLRLQDFAAAQGLRLAVAALDGGDTYWHARRSGVNALAALQDEFEPLCAERYGLGAGGRGRALYGVSMGGFGAALAAQRQPDRYGALVLSSAAVWPTRGEQASAVPDAFDGARDFAANDVIAGADRFDARRVRLDCGSSDPFVAGNRELAQRLGRKATVSFAEGCHDRSFWLRVAPAQLRFVADRLGLQRA